MRGFVLSRLFCILVCAVVMPWASASTIVRVSSSLGDFSLELFDDSAPGTVNNFLNYVNSDRYDGTVIHRSEPGFVIQGGWLKFNESQYTFTAIPRDPNIANEFGISNRRGTIAMAKVAGNPDSANSQWFINLADNTSLDSPANNGGYTVFGQVLGDGMSVVDSIQALPRWLLVANSPFPTINFNGGTLTNGNLVNIAMSVVGDTDTHPNIYDSTSGLLFAKVNAGPAGLLSLVLTVTDNGASTIAQIDLDSVELLNEPVASMASFDFSTQRLTLPELVMDGRVVFSNVTFLLSNAENLSFLLESYAVDAPNWFDVASGKLHTAIAAGTAGNVAANFSIVSLAPAIVIRLDLDSLQALEGELPGMANFNADTGQLRLPELWISPTAKFSNLVFQLTDAQQLTFTLVSFSQD